MAFERVLVPVTGDDSTTLTTAVRAVNPVAGRVRLLHVRSWRPSPPPSREDGGLLPLDVGELFDETAAQAVELLDSALRHARARGLTADGIVVEAPRSGVANAIVSAAESWDAEVIILVRRHRNILSVWMWGSVSEQVLRDASCPVLVVRARPA